MTIDTSTLARAISDIARFFEENMTDQDGVITNALAFPQEKILNGMCYSATNGAAYTANVTLQKAKDELAEALDSHKGDELSDVKLARKVNWMNKIEDQLVHLEAFKAEALAAYEKHTGKAYVHERPKMQVVGGVKPTDAVAQARAKLGRTAGPDTSYNSTQMAGEVQHGLRASAAIPKKAKA